MTGNYSIVQLKGLGSLKLLSTEDISLSYFSIKPLVLVKFYQIYAIRNFFQIYSKTRFRQLAQKTSEI
jgi:hypothetical protein